MRDLAQFERRAGEHLDAAYNLAYWLVRDRDDAKDVVQDAYLRAFRAYAKFAGEDIRPWLLTIVRNVAYRWLSVRKRRANVISFDGAVSGRSLDGEHALDVASDEPSVEQVLVGHAEQALVRRALGELPPIYREAIVLRELEGLSYQEIAQATAIPIGTVMSRLARAREHLRIALARMIAREDKDAL
jgi:RNA polymerase sigma-70 factor (ECF subfamily)